MGSLVKGVFPNPGNTTEVKEWRSDGEEKGAITGNLWIISDIKRKKNQESFCALKRHFNNG